MSDYTDNIPTDEEVQTYTSRHADDSAIANEPEAAVFSGTEGLRPGDSMGDVAEDLPATDGDVENPRGEGVE